MLLLAFRGGGAAGVTLGLVGRAVVVVAEWFRRFWWAVAAVAVALVGLGVYLALPSAQPGRVLPPPRARVYSAFGACLLTDSDGVAGQAAAPVWAGMQAASLKTSAKVSYLAVSGPDTVANAENFVNTLVQRKCDLVLAVGVTEASAVQARAKAYPAVRFVVVGSGAAGGNVTVIPPGSADGGRDAVAAAVEAAYVS
jgi:hypothetical protein